MICTLSDPLHFQITHKGYELRIYIITNLQISRELHNDVARISLIRVESNCQMPIEFIASCTETKTKYNNIIIIDADH